MEKLRIYTHSAGLGHDTGPVHPERQDRLRVLMDIFSASPFNTIKQIEALKARREWIARAHDEAYITAIHDSAPGSGSIMLDSDTVMSPGTLEAALRAAGAPCQAVEDIASGKTQRAFCAMRPPGHHAEPNLPMGFCIFNNIFIGARHAQEACGFKKIAIVDFDVHHGNGTETMTRRAEDIFFISSHQAPLWPGTGDPRDNVDGQIMNVTLNAGDGGDAFRKLYEREVFPALNDFKPDLLMISAGFDAHRDDPLAGLNLVEDDYTWVTTELVKIADRHAKGRVVSVLEGGYNLDALKSSAAAHLNAMVAD
jgi:acetoin utilization deacetylase AcuC-like enzyme